jgi:hypothetical protein
VQLVGTKGNLNTALAAANGVVYTPTANYNGTDPLTMTTSDGGNTGAGGALTDTDTVNLVINAVNDAPVLADTALSLPALAQGSTTVPPDGATTTLGVAVSSLLGGVTDADTAALQGIAITAINSGGKLYYMSNSNVWTEITGGGSAVSASNAFLIASYGTTNRLVFVPTSSTFNGNISDAFTFRAWDKTITTTGGVYKDTTINGGITEFSAATDTVSQYVVKPVTINAVSTDNLVGASEVLVVSGTSDANATVTVTIGGTGYNVTANASGIWTYTGSASSTMLTAGANTITAAELVSGVSSSANVSVTLDATAPTSGTLALAADTGAGFGAGTSSDGITRNNQINVNGLEGGTTTWEYSIDSGANWTSGTGTSFTLVDGTYVANALQVRQTDAAGNVQATSVKYASQIKVDTTTPAAPLAIYFSDDHGTSGSDWTTTSDAGATTFYVVSSTGGRATSETVQYSTDGGTTWASTSPSIFGANGLAVVMQSPLPTTATTYTIRIVDIAGNVSSTFTKTFTPSALPTGAASATTFTVPSTADSSTQIGSASDDTIVLNQSGITNYLSQSTAYLEGRGGNDILRLTGAGTSLN